MQHRPADLAEFPMILTLPVQWGDQDPFGHVNNVVFFRWFESARIAYCEQVGMDGMSRDAETGPILASIRCDYRRQLRFPDTVLIGASVTRLGRSSFTMMHRAYSTAQGQTVADGESALVCFNYIEQTTIPIPADLRERIAALEGKAL